MATPDSCTPNRAEAAALFVKYSEELLAFFRAMLPMAKGDARDLLQQTFEQLLKWQDGDPTRSIDHGRGLLFKIAHRRVSAFHQKRARVPQTTDVPDTLPDAGLAADVQQHDLEYLTSLHEDRRGVLRAMRRLGPTEAGEAVCDQQLLLYLRFFAGMTEGEAAEIFERPRATIAGQLRRARAALERELAALDRREPGIARTSTTLLQHWWSEVEARAEEVALTEPEPPPPEKSPSGP